MAKGFSQRSFTFSKVFDESAEQCGVYREIGQPLVHAVLSGINATLMAYGQTGSGKTHTCGTALDTQGLSEEQMGLLPRMVDEVIAYMEGKRGAAGAAATVATASAAAGAAGSGDMAAEEDGAAAGGAAPSVSPSTTDCKLTVQYVQIYNEQVIDLLRDSSNLKVIHDRTQGFVVPDASEREIRCRQDLQAVLEDGASRRAVAATNMNATSSRSHAIFTLKLEQTLMVKAKGEGLRKGGAAGTAADAGAAAAGGGSESPAEDEEVLLIPQKCVSILRLADLAGSERVSQTGAKGTTLKEATSINKGLSTLAQVITAVSKKSKHVPIRDSK